MAFNYRHPDGSWSIDLRGPPVEVHADLPDNIEIINRKNPITTTTTEEKPKRKTRAKKVKP